MKIMTFEIFDEVRLVKRTEIENGFFLDERIKGLVIDETVPNYYLVRFENHGAYWVDGKHLNKIN